MASQLKKNTHIKARVQNHTLFMTKMAKSAKIDTLFMTKTVEKQYPYWEYPPPPWRGDIHLPTETSEIEYMEYLLSVLWVKLKSLNQPCASLPGFVIVDNSINSSATPVKIKKTGVKFFSVTDESRCLWRRSNGELTLR